MKNLTYRNAVIRSHDDDARTVELSFSSEEPVARWEGLEILDHAPGSIRTERLQNGAPLLMDHNTRDQIGVVESVKFGSDRKGRAVVRFSRSARADDIYRDVVDGIRGNVSVGYLIHETRKEGADSYRVTDWEPYEISIVGVPADTTVGVGRAADTTPRVGKRSAKTSRDVAHLGEMIERVMRHTGGFPRTNENGDVSQFIPMPPAEVRNLTLSDVLAPNGGATASFSESLALRSLVAQAGATIIPMGEVVQYPVGKAGAVATTRVKDKFVTMLPGKYTMYQDGKTINLSNKPYLVATYDSNTAPCYGVGYQLTRHQMKHDFADDTVLISVNRAIEDGLADLVDYVALSAISGVATALTDASFKTLAKLSTARGLRFDELRALAGGELAGVEMASDGIVRACGVRAELTNQTDKTIIGTFSRVAVGIDDDIRVTVKRQLNAGVEIVVWVNTQALIPDPSAFWMA
ncbi:HK97 family phage prohead protease [Salmonella enterica]|nr:HK97 family phage prohead protease [Salmonella enterica]MBH0756530.1 HK97 family phage prohead protease [Salmonella enterica]